MSKPLTLILTLVLVSAGANATEVTYRKDVRPLWEQKCIVCHGAGSPYLGDFLEHKQKHMQALKGPRMDTYADLIFFVGWPDTGAVMRRLDDGRYTTSGKPGNMYQYLGADEAERQKNLKVFKAWVGEDAWTHKRWDAHGDMPGVTKEELGKMKVKY